MSIEIREYIGSSMNITESTMTKRPVNLNENFNEIGPISKDSIIQFIEGIHAGPTRNFTWYTEQALEDSVPTWTKPYQRPLIMHHNEKDGKTIGRILNAEYVTRNTRSGTPALSFVCNVPDKDGKEQILDGRLKTVSIGVIAHDVRCSICGEQIELDEYGSSVCGHDRGASYEGETCYWMIYKMEAKELSYVIVPSDIYAHNTKTMKPEDYLKTTKAKKDLKENAQDNLNLNEGVTNMSVEKQNLQEGQVIDETVKDGEEIAKTEKPETKEEPAKKDKEEKAEEPKEEAKDSEETKESKEKKEDKEEATKESKESKEEEVDPKDKEIEELKAKIEKIETEKEAVTKDLVNLKKELEDAVKKVEEITVELNSKEDELKKEIELKEAVETELANAKLEIRESKENELNSLRRSLNKPVLVKEALTARSDESLRDAICDLKEELEGISNLKNIQEANDPTIVKEENEKNNKSNVKESNTVGNINVEEGLADIFSSMFDRRFI